MAAAEESSAARLRMMCSHGGLFLPCGPDGAIRYVGGQTRVLVVQREVSFRELSSKLEEMAVGEIVSALRYRLADDDGVIVSVTCDEELAHMRDEYDRLKATRPSATFRVFFSGQRRAGSSGRPPLPPKMRRVQSEPALAAPARPRDVHRAAATDAARAERAGVRRVQSLPADLLRPAPPALLLLLGCNRRHDQYRVPSPVPLMRECVHHPPLPRTRKVRAKNLLPWQRCPRTHMVRARKAKNLLL